MTSQRTVEIIDHEICLARKQRQVIRDLLSPLNRYSPGYSRLYEEWRCYDKLVVQLKCEYEKSLIEEIVEQCNALGSELKKLQQTFERSNSKLNSEPTRDVKEVKVESIEIKEECNEETEPQLKHGEVASEKEIKVELPTQYYMAMLYTVTTLSLAMQTIYYGHIYPRLKSNKRHYTIDTVEKYRVDGDDTDQKEFNSACGFENGSQTLPSGVTPSSPIPLPASGHGSVGGEFYYTSARSLSRSHTPTFGFPMQKRTTSAYEWNSIDEPLIGGQVSTGSAPSSKTKTMLCVVSALTFFLSMSNLQHLKGNRNAIFDMQDRGFVVQVGRKLLQVNRSLLLESGSSGTAEIGSVLGWGMAIIYMGGRLPQIFLNFRRGNVQGLNPLMFIFALFGNATYVGSILVSSLDWAKLKPNLPWLVDAGGCVVLDFLILIQFIYFWYHPPQVLEKNESSNIT